jgi:hypothetical protein
MKHVLLQPRSIAGATFWGAITACVVFAGLLVADVAWSWYRESFGPAYRVDSIAVGGGYSINIIATPAHPFLAEYKQVVAIYGGGPRDGAHLGDVEIPMNTGGRVRIAVLVPGDPGKPEVVLVDRYATTRIDLVHRAQVPGPSVRRDRTLKPLGWVTGESYPMKFVPCAVWPAISSEEREDILRDNAEFKDFCDERS